jgi:phage antirepressor YoqD-like protein
MSIVIGTTSVRLDSNGRFNLNDLHIASGGAHRHRPPFWLKNKKTQEVIADRLISGNPELAPVVATRGRYGGTYAIKGLVYSYSMWVSARFHNQVVDAYDAMARAAEPGHILPSSLAQAYRDLAALADENEELKKQVAQSEAAVSFHIDVGDTSKTFSITEAGHLLGVGGQEFGRWMQSKGFIYKRGGPWLAKQPMLAGGYLESVLIDANNGLRQQCRVTGEGLKFLHGKLKTAKA